ncbi:MAG: PAAR domain-containing protein [Chloroflexota bacterium]|nr:PAAR domain-containing protein [Chloroflexota bacterium]
MGTPAAVLGDSVMGTCLHTYQSTTPSPGGPVPTPVPMTLPFQGTIIGGMVPTVLICGKPAITLGAAVVNKSIHPPVGGASIPGPAVPPATNKATIIDGSPTVLIGGKPAVRTGCKTTPECGLTGPAIVQGTGSTVLIA